MTGRLLTAREASERLAVSTETLLRWVRRGQVPAIRLPGGAIRIREDELERWLLERATPAPGVLATEADAAENGRYRAGDRESSPVSTDASTEGARVASFSLATTPRMAAAPEDQEQD